MSKNSKIIIGLVLVVIVAIVAYLFYKKSSVPVTTTTVSSTSGLAGFDLGTILGAFLDSGDSQISQ